MSKPYKGPINVPCSACSAGDIAMEYHSHEHVKLENRRTQQGAEPRFAPLPPNMPLTQPVPSQAAEVSEDCGYLFPNTFKCVLPKGHEDAHDWRISRVDPWDQKHTVKEKPDQRLWTQHEVDTALAAQRQNEMAAKPYIESLQIQLAAAHSDLEAAVGEAIRACADATEKCIFDTCDGWARNRDIKKAIEALTPATILANLARREQELRLEVGADTAEMCLDMFQEEIEKYAAKLRAELATVKGLGLI